MQSAPAREEFTQVLATVSTLESHSKQHTATIELLREEMTQTSMHHKEEIKSVNISCAELDSKLGDLCDHISQVQEEANRRASIDPMEIVADALADAMVPVVNRVDEIDDKMSVMMEDFASMTNQSGETVELADQTVTAIADRLSSSLAAPEVCVTSELLNKCNEFNQVVNSNRRQSEYDAEISDLRMQLMEQEENAAKRLSQESATIKPGTLSESRKLPRNPYPCLPRNQFHRPVTRP